MNAVDRPPRPLYLKNTRVIDPSRNIDEMGAVVIAEGTIIAAGAEALEASPPHGADIIDCKGAVVAPGLIDMAVYVGEPGAEHRETLASAGQAAAAGGVTTIVTMPDTDPVIDDAALVDFIARRARDTAPVRVLPAAAITEALAGEEITEFGLLLEAGAVALTDGRHTVMNALLMRRALSYARDFGALIMHKPVDTNLAAAGVMNEGETATRLGLPGIPREAETIMLERDLRLAALTGARYHASSISCATSLDVMRRARDAGVKASCAVSINHLTLNENDIGSYRTFFKMSPPLRSEDDRQEMIAGVASGEIDVIVSAHDPQDVDTKRHPFEEAADGAVGLETLLPAALRLYHQGAVSLMTLIRAMSTRPAELLGLDTGRLTAGAPADIVIFDPNEPWVLDSDLLRSRSKNTPFSNARFQGRTLHTVVGGRVVFSPANAGLLPPPRKAPR